VPIYIIRPKDSDPQSIEGVRLVRAKNPAKVRDHIAAIYSIEADKGDAAIEFAAAGVKLETAAE
jgi:hypothetical protein